MFIYVHIITDAVMNIKMSKLWDVLGFYPSRLCELFPHKAPLSVWHLLHSNNPIYNLTPPHSYINK